MSIRSRSTAFAFVLAIAAAPLAAFAGTPLPGQPGADTSLGQELRGQPYPASTEWSQFKPTVNTMTTASMSKSIYGSLSIPGNLIY
ncbi:MAG TPA: hypothetical protein VGL83_17970 [Stellaceae bacterium]|jgi:hypothetical protein